MAVAKVCAFILTAATLLFTVPAVLTGQLSGGYEIVAIPNGDVTLHAMIWRPSGQGPFPAILLNHGSGRSAEELRRLGPYERQAESLGPVFARHGYVLLYLFRRGVGLSADQGENSVDLMNRELAERGQEARNTLQIRLLEGREMNAALSGLGFLLSRPEVDSRRIALIGDSFGGSLALLLAEREHNIRAVVVTACAGYSWDRSSELRDRLFRAVRNITAPVFFLHAANDYSVAPGKALTAQLERLTKPNRLMIYPPIGATPEEGHGLLYLGVSSWESDVFAFLDEHTQQ